MIHLNDLFHTVQGEGAHAGRRALFVRMPFCNLACSWCDTSFNSFKEWSEEDFIAFTKKENTRFAVITGGEPTMHKDLPKVVELLKSEGFYIAVETNGHFPILDGIDWVCCSPKRDGFRGREAYYIDIDVYPRVSEFKYVVDDNFDFPMLDERGTNVPGRFYWLSPEHTNWKRNVDLILEYIAKNPSWRLNLQTHKLIGVP